MAETGSSLQGPHVEVLRVVRLCHPGWEGLSPVTFTPQPVNPAWQVWREEFFLPILLPALRIMRIASAEGNRRELVAQETFLNERLPSAMAERSRRAGQTLIKNFSAPPAEKLWRYYGSQVEAGEVPGHLATVLAVRAAAFHVAPPALVSAYLYMEARAGLGAEGVTQWMEMTDDCLRASAGQGSPGLRAA